MKNIENIFKQYKKTYYDLRYKIKNNKIFSKKILKIQSKYKKIFIYKIDKFTMEEIGEFIYKNIVWQLGDGTNNEAILDNIQLIINT